ncbi:MAG: succinyl-diaminopimelate desuccinylase, partial [Pseudomonadota bacterium]
MSPTLDLTLNLLQRASLTPDDAGCQALLTERLRPLGFKIEALRFVDVDNLWARFGDAAPLFVFAGHTDVVPTGDASTWKYPPFTPTIDNGMLYGRGAADMKGAIAAFVTACERFLAKHPQPKGSIALLITSDEEGPSINGTVKVVEHLEARHEKMNWCLV